MATNFIAERVGSIIGLFKFDLTQVSIDSHRCNITLCIVTTCKAGEMGYANSSDTQF